MPIIKNCLTCDKEFRTVLSKIKKGWGKFCSHKCAMTGKYSPTWKGDNASYYAIHIWINQHYGSPKYCENCKTKTAKKFEWANISGKYHRDIKDFKRLCVKCHRAFDNSCEKGENRYNSKLTEKDVLNIRHLYSPRKYTMVQLAKEFNISFSVVQAIISRRRWKHI